MAARILVVDDEEDLAAMCQTILETAGFEVETRNSLSGLGDAVREFSPDLILLDWILGTETADRTLEDLAKRRSCPIYVMTALRGVEPTARRLGAADLLWKPFDAEALLRTVRSAIAASSAG